MIVVISIIVLKIKKNVHSMIILYNLHIIMRFSLVV